MFKKYLPYTIIFVIILMFTLTYVSVPLYKLFCQTYALGGATAAVDISKLQNKVISTGGLLFKNNGSSTEKYINLFFHAQVHDSLPLTFYSDQPSFKAFIGKCTLIIFKLYNHSDADIMFSSTYNVLPYKAGLYFNKVQCFCFEDQIIEGNSSIDLPVLFFIDPDFIHDSAMSNINNIVLSYSVFKIDSPF